MQIPLDFGGVKRDRGMADSMSTFAKGEIRTAIVLCASKHTTFTAEEVRSFLGASVKDQLQMHPNALGAAIHAAARANLIETTGMTKKATHPDAHSRRILVWRLKPKGS